MNLTSIGWRQLKKVTTIRHFTNVIERKNVCASVVSVDKCKFYFSNLPNQIKCSSGSTLRRGRTANFARNNRRVGGLKGKDSNDKHMLIEEART